MSAPLIVEPSACTWCGIARRGHGRQFADAAGWHEWSAPSQEQILARMKARRLALVVAREGALPMPVAPEPVGEFYAYLHHDNRVPHDLPEAISLSAPTDGGEAAPIRCRCDEPDADPYECEAEDCGGYFSELNPFGGGPVPGHDAKVSRACGQCDYRTSVWHVDDGSAEEELHGHVVRVHGGYAVGGPS